MTAAVAAGAGTDTTGARVGVGACVGVTVGLSVVGAGLGVGVPAAAERSSECVKLECANHPIPTPRDERETNAAGCGPEPTSTHLAITHLMKRS